MHKDVQTSLSLSSDNYKRSQSCTRKELQLTLLKNILCQVSQTTKPQLLSVTDSREAGFKQILLHGTNATSAYAHLYYR